MEGDRGEDMILRNLCIIGLSAIALSACGGDSSETAAPADAAATTAALTLDGEGLRAPSGLIAFGAPAAEAIAAATAALGSEPTTTPNPDCPTGATDDYAWGNRLALITRDGAFIGWHSSESGPTTSSGIHTGSAKTDAFEVVPSNFEQTQISVDGVSGFLNADNATVGVLYSGDTCIAG